MIFPFSPVIVDLTWLPRFLKYDGQRFGNYIYWYHQYPGMLLIMSHDLYMFRFLRWSLTKFSPVMGVRLQWPRFCLEVLGRFEKTDYQGKLRPKNCWVHQLFPCQSSVYLPYYILSISSKLEGVFLFCSPFLINIPIEAIVYYFSNSRFSFWHALAFLIPSPTCQRSISISFLRCMFLLPLPMHFHLALQFCQEMFTQPFWSPASLVWYLALRNWEILCLK